MTFHQFTQAVEKRLKEVISEDITLSVYVAEKNNGVKKVGITFTKEGVNLSPTIYLEEYYEKYQDGFSLEDVVNSIWYLYRGLKVKKSWDEDSISDFRAMEEHIIYRLINAEANRQLLKSVPHIPYLDLAIVFYVVMEIDEHGSACMLIREEHMEMWETTMPVLYEKAKENTWRILPSEFFSMKSIMEECHAGWMIPGKEILYVLSNRMRNFGATSILYEGCLEMIAEFLNDNYYVLPSSVHEVIIISEKDAFSGKMGLSQMVREINQTEVEAEDILSDNAYYYDCKKKKLV